jgi:GntR family transcriptional repressor for pyruvate dehydrogenase complex
MFHLSIAQASANPYFATAMQALEDHIAVGMRFDGLSLCSTSDGLQHVFMSTRPSMRRSLPAMPMQRGS